MTKLMIASDLHGSARYCREMLAAYQREGASSLLLLGDLLYHGPRNDLPDGYAPKEVAQMLNDAKRDLMCVHGNCDAEVDQMVLEFPITAQDALIYIDGQAIFATHGHLSGPQNVPPLPRGCVLLYGHTHVPACERISGTWCLNPGSVSLPKEDSAHGYMTYQDGVFSWKDMAGETYRTWRVTP